MRLVWLDVFDVGPLSGNQLGVVLDAEDLAAAEMQALAAELGLAETIFVAEPSRSDCAASVRIFTPEVELPMAGHPVVGAAWLLCREGLIPATARIETGVGPLEIEASGDGARMVQAPPVGPGSVDVGAVAAALGVEAADGPTPAVWSTGIDQLMFPVSSIAEVANLAPDLAALAALGRSQGWIGVSVYCVDPPGGPARARVRHFAPTAGVAEDVGTGSAAGGLGACLFHAGWGSDGVLELQVDQGREDGRRSRIDVRVEPDPVGSPRVRVGGAVRQLFEARIDPASLR